MHKKYMKLLVIDLLENDTNTKGVIIRNCLKEQLDNPNYKLTDNNEIDFRTNMLDYVKTSKSLTKMEHIILVHGFHNVFDDYTLFNLLIEVRKLLNTKTLNREQTVRLHSFIEAYYIDYDGIIDHTDIQLMDDINDLIYRINCRFFIDDVKVFFKKITGRISTWLTKRKET